MNQTSVRSSRARGRSNDRRVKPAHPQAPTKPTSSQRVAPDAAPDNAFVRLGVSPALAGQLQASGIVEPFPIQTATLPDSLAGRDVLGRGKTGSGKTVAFALPLIAALASSSTKTAPGRPRGLVLVPTRELANQVADVLRPLASATSLTVATVFGGVGQRPQVDALRASTDIIVACPGRLEDLVAQGHCRLDRVQVAVLDEADLMSDLGFLPAVRRLLDATPKGGQRLLFSATLDNGVKAIVDRFLSDPVVQSVDPAVGVDSVMEHHVFGITQTDKAAVVRSLASGRDRVLFFARTKYGAAKWAKQLNKSGIPAVDLHGNLGQGARERNLEMFSSGKSLVLVATDIAARGIHVDDVALVVHIDPPADHKTYVHRSGRTARAGAEGVVITLMTPEQTEAVGQLAKAAGIRPKMTRVTPGDATIQAMIGGTAQRVAAAPVAKPVAAPVDTAPRPSRPQGQGRRRRRR